MDGARRAAAREHDAGRRAAADELQPHDVVVGCSGRARESASVWRTRSRAGYGSERTGDGAVSLGLVAAHAEV